MWALGSEYLWYCFFEKELYFILSEIRNIYLWNTLLFCITKTVLGPTQNQNCCLQQPFVIYYVNDAPNHLAQILKRLKTIAIYWWASLPIMTLWVNSWGQIYRLLVYIKFTNKHKLKKHVGTVHEGIKPFKYSTCDVKFSNNYNP